jgi:hypothetical protein
MIEKHSVTRLKGKSRCRKYCWDENVVGVCFIQTSFSILYRRERGHVYGKDRKTTRLKVTPQKYHEICAEDNQIG